MAAQIKTWASDGFLSALIQRLVAENFLVFISADHGNVEAEGIGIPREGTLSETNGQRNRVYSDLRLRAAGQAAIPGSTCWDHHGLPKDFHCLLAPPGKAFVQQGKVVVCHGGISLDEVIVPFIEISRRKAV
jgi:hypothetical protein